MFQRILVPIDGSGPARAGLREALALATAHHAALCLLHIVDDVPLLDDLSNLMVLAADHQALVAKGQGILAAARALCEARDVRVEAKLHELEHGRVSDAIAQQAQALACDLIVIGSHGRRGIVRTLIGSDAEAVLRASPVPVLMVREVAETSTTDAVGVRVPYRSILVPVDGSETSDLGLEKAIRLARLTQGRLRLVHVVDELSMVDALDPALTVTLDWIGELREGGKWILEQAAQRARSEGLRVQTLLVDDFGRRLWEVVADEAANWLADVVVLGSHGRRGFDRLLLGSDAEQILRHSPVPVLLVRGVRSEADASAVAVQADLAASSHPA